MLQNFVNLPLLEAVFDKLLNIMWIKTFILLKDEASLDVIFIMQNPYE